MNDLGFLLRNPQVNLGYNGVLTESTISGIQSRKTTSTSINQYNIDRKPLQFGQSIGRAWNNNKNCRFDFRFLYLPRRADDSLGRGSGDFRIPERYSFSSNFGYNFSSNPAQNIALSLSLEAGQEDLGSKVITSGLGLVWWPNDCFSFYLGLSYTDKEPLPGYQGSKNHTSFEAHQRASKLGSNYYISSKQKFSISMQWNSLKASENRFWEADPSRLEYLNLVANSDNNADDFVISRLIFQACYRWEIAPLSDLFAVYTRESNFPGNSFFIFQGLLEQAWNYRIVNSLAIKFRYRFGV
jgi:hypothetical protein